MAFFGKFKSFLVSRKFILSLVLLGLTWIIIIWGSTSLFDSYTHHGETIEVPNLLKNNVDDIPALIGDRKLQYEVLDSIYNPDLVEGTIVYQDPMPTDSSGLQVKEGRTIKVRISKRNRLVNMPVVVSRSQRFAEAILQTKGLRTKIKYVPSAEDQGSVIAAKYQGKVIDPGHKLPINSIIELTIGKRSFENLISIPNLSGLTIKEAEARFSDGIGLQLFPICSHCITAEDSLKARIYKQTPIAGDSSKIAVGSTITVFLSPKEMNSTDE